MGILAASVNLLPDTTFFFQLAVFGAAVGIMSWGIFGPVSRVLDLRKQKTIGDSTEAAGLLARADALATQYADKIRDTRLACQATKEELRQEGFASAAQIMESARVASVKELEAARKTIQSQVDTARKALADEANTFALTIVKKLAMSGAGVTADYAEESKGAHE